MSATPQMGVLGRTRIESSDIAIDLVPAAILQSATDDNRIFYVIPKGDIYNNWIVTNPLEDSALLNQIASGRDQYRNVIRILKYVRDNYACWELSSFAIECCAIHCARNKFWYNSLFLDLDTQLSYLAERLRAGVILDTYDYQSNLLEDSASRIKYAERIEQVQTTLMRQLGETYEPTAYREVCAALGNF